MGLGTWERIHTLIAALDTVCLLSSRLYTFYVMVAFIDFFNIMTEKKTRVWVFCSACSETNFWKKKIASLEELSIHRKENFLKYR